MASSTRTSRTRSSAMATTTVSAMERGVTLRPGEWIVVAGSVLIAAFAALVGALIHAKPPPVEFVYAETAASRVGEAVYRREGCGTCHQVFGNGATYGPKLDGVGTRRSAAWLRAYLIDPRPGVGERPYRVHMPAYAGLPASERDALVDYLQALRAPPERWIGANTPRHRRSHDGTRPGDTDCVVRFRHRRLRGAGRGAVGLHRHRIDRERQAIP